jgi:hypothetical protein
MSATQTLAERIASWTNDLTRAERETVITRADDEQAWTVTTTSPVMLRRLWRIYGVRGTSFEELSEWAWRVTIPKQCVSLRRIAGDTQAIEDSEEGAAS